jgi:A/G-specific adenine glycosylase
VLLKKGRVLLEKRPSIGLWGGLLTFPERASERWRIRSRETLPVVEHGFTHFRLRATPVVCAVDAVRAAQNQRWMPLTRATLAPLPTPVKKLLAQIAQGSDPD